MTENTKGNIIGFTGATLLILSIIGITALGISAANGQEKTASESIEILPEPKPIEYTKIPATAETNEIVEMRTPNTQVFKISDSEYKLKLFLTDTVFYKENDGWLKSDIISLLGGIAYAATATVSNSADNYMVEGSPTSNYGTNQWLCSGEGSTNNNYRTLFRATIPSSASLGTITATKLYLYKGSQGTNSGGHYSELHDLTQTAWNETQSTWNKYDTSNNWVSAGGDFNSTVISTKAIDTNNNVWHSYSFSGAWNTTYNWLIKRNTAGTTDNNYDCYYSRDYGVASVSPYLEITYTPSPPTITTFSPSSGTTGETITLTGTYYTSTATMSMYDGHTSTTMNNFEYTDTTSVKAHVPSGLTHNTEYYIVYTNANGTATSSTTFHYHNNDGIAADNTRYTTILLTIVATFTIFDFMRRIYTKKV